MNNVPFLRQVAEHYCAQGDIERKCFIFPNRRSMVFFRKYLCEVPSRAPFVMPGMFTINDFFAKAAGCAASDRVRLLIELHSCYSALNPKAEPLDEFIFWGDVILGDFNDVDKYLADPAQLFANVADFKQIQDTYSYLTPTQRKALESFLSHFNDASGKLTVDIGSDNPNVKARFLQIWNILYPLYKNYNKSLKDKGMAYEGMVYRSLADKLRLQSAADVFEGMFPEGTVFVFIGLNALNECEKMLLRKLRDASMAEFCWDWSGEMIRNPQNRSSFFMADNVQEFPQAGSWDKNGLSTPRVRVVSVPSSFGQAKRLPDILKDINPEETAIVLPDENMLTPVLNSIPPEIRDINVTMGLPATSGEFFCLMSCINSIQLHATNRAGKWYFYHKQVWDLFSTSIFKMATDRDEEIKNLVTEIKKGAKYYIAREDFASSQLLSEIFTPVIRDQKSTSPDQINAFAEYQKNVISMFGRKMASNPDSALELEFASHYYKCVNILQDISLAVMPMTYVRLLNQLFSSVSVHFRGEPLKGMQIMGPLETRALDFTNLIIMSCGEGIFPRRSVSSSFIPPELRKGFGLPTYEYQDAVWAYYFYRMISRAENVWMLVDSRTEGLRSGEESRYIKQLEYHFNLPVERYVVKFDSMSVMQVKDIEKTEEDIREISRLKLSATALQNYLSCPAKFYYSSVRHLKMEDEVAESLDMGMFGTVYHEAMRSIYSFPEAMSPEFDFDDKGENEVLPYMQSVSRQYIKEWLGREDDIRRKVKTLIMRQINAMDISGRNIVVADVIVRYVRKTLQRDLEILQNEGVEAFDILGREVEVTGELHGQRFKGYIDRLDSFREGTVRIVDYKTGKVLDHDYDITDDNAQDIADEIFTPDIKDRPKIALQFYIYDMLCGNLPQVKGKTLLNCIYSTAKLFREAPVSVPCNAVFTNRMTGHLASMLDRMKDIGTPFTRTSNEEICSYCDFKNICGR